MSLSIAPADGYYTYKVSFEDEAGLCAGWFIHRSKWDTTSHTTEYTAEVTARLKMMFPNDVVAWSGTTHQAVTPASFENI